MRRRPGQAGPCAPGLWASAPPQMRLRIGPRSLRIGPSGKQQPLGKARPGPTRQSGQKPKGSASHPRRRFYRNGGRMGRCSLPVRSGKGKQLPQGKENQAAPLPRGTRGTPAHGAGMPLRRTPRKAKASRLTAGLAWRSPARQRRKQGCAAPMAAHPPPHTPPKKGYFAMMISIQVPNAQAGLELENALLLNLLDIQRQLDALKGKNTRYAIHRRALLQQRYKLCEEWKQSVVRQSATLFNV